MKKYQILLLAILLINLAPIIMEIGKATGSYHSDNRRQDQGHYMVMINDEIKREGFTVMISDNLKSRINCPIETASVIILFIAVDSILTLIKKKNGEPAV